MTEGWLIWVISQIGFKFGRNMITHAREAQEAAQLSRLMATHIGNAQEAQLGRNMMTHAREAQESHMGRNLTTHHGEVPVHREVFDMPFMQNPLEAYWSQYYFGPK